MRRAVKFPASLHCYRLLLLLFSPQVPLKVPLQLTWRCGPDMPFGMESNIQSVMVQGTVYVGGGYLYGGEETTVMGYDTCSGKWTKLPPYRAAWFAMTVIHNQLVLVGGSEDGHMSKVVGVWRADRKEWTHPYPEMTAARYQCSASSDWWQSVKW